MKKWYKLNQFSLVCGIILLFVSIAPAADKVVVIPLGGTVGNATVADVLEGKTFSSTTAGKRATGILKIRNEATIYTNSIGMEFSLIPAGSFIMGSPDGSGDTSHPPVQPAEPGRWDSEKQHQVTLTKSFYMQTTEVTQGQWEQVMGSGSNPANFKFCGMDCPVEMISWEEANNYILVLNNREHRTWLSCQQNNHCPYKLPTEAQWEYAARAGTVTAFYSGEITQPFGEDPNLNQIGWYVENSAFCTHPIAQKQANNWGLYDMSGNVWEWCEDWYDKNYPDGPVPNPTGPLSGSDRVSRGGAWNNVAQNVRSANRAGLPPSGHWDIQGFRLVFAPGP